MIMLAPLRDLWFLFSLRRAFRRLPVERHLRPASDPTLMFAGILYGRRAFVETGLHRIFWDLKRALFFYGDAIIEAYLKKYGIESLCHSYGSTRSDDAFFLFPEQAVRELGLTAEHGCLVELYASVR